MNDCQSEGVPAVRFLVSLMPNSKVDLDTIHRLVMSVTGSLHKGSPLVRVQRSNSAFCSGLH